MSKRVRDEDVVDSAIVDSKRKSEKKKKKKRRKKKKSSKKSKELEIKSVEPEIVITQEKDEVEEIDISAEIPKDVRVFLKHNHKISSKYNSTFISLSPSYSQSFIYIVHTLQYNH